MNWFTPHKVRTLVATGSEGIAYLDYIEQTLTIHNYLGIHKADVNKAEPLRLELDNFLNSISEGKQPSVNGIEGKAILKIALESDHNNYYATPSNINEGRDVNAHSVLTKRSKIVAAIPCFNTERTIGNVVVETKKYVDEVIVVDDGSYDKTSEIAKTAGATVITLDRNHGKGAAMKTAARIADCDILVFIDGDGQHRPEEIPDLVKPISDEKADFVIGSRFLPKSKTLHKPVIRGAANSAASFVVSFIISYLLPLAKIVNRNHGSEKDIKGIQEARNGSFGYKSEEYRLLNGKFKRVSDCTSGFSAMKKNNWETIDLISDGFQIETEMIFENAKKGVTIAEVPITCSWDISSSRLSVMKDGFSTLILLAKKLVLYSSK